MPLDACSETVDQASGGVHSTGQGSDSTRSASVVELPTLDDTILKSVHVLGHYRRIKVLPSSTEEQRGENELAQKIRKKWTLLLPETYKSQVPSTSSDN